LFLGQLYFEKGDYESARKQFDEALKIEPENGKILLALADVYRAQKNTDKAFSYLQAAFTKPELDVDLKIQVLLTLFGEMEKNPSAKAQALALGLEATRLHPEEPKTWAMYADLLYHSGNSAEAKTAYKQAITTDKGNQKFTVWQQYLLSLLDVQDFESLSPEADKAVELFPNQALPYFLSGLAKNQLKAYAKAIEVLRSGVFYVGANRELEANFYATLGDAYNELGRFEESDESYGKTLKIQPENALVLNNWSYYLSLRKSKLEQAEEMIKRAVKIEPKNPSYLDTYAWVMYQQGKYKEALEWMELALAQAGDDRATLYEHYGDILYRLGEETKALEYWRKAKAAGMQSDFIDRKIADGKLYE
jgi:tetratricopeptide (TPR) repeat protein